MANKEIHCFASKWFDKFRNTDTTETEIIEDFSFADDCFSYGFEMDCGKSLIEKFPDKKVFDDWQELDKVIDTIDDVQLLGTAIFSKWRYFNHWADSGESIVAESNRAWFITALGRLGRLTADEGEYAFFVSGAIKNMKLHANCLGYGLPPMEGEIVEQHLTVTSDGRIFYSEYCFGLNGKYKKKLSRNFKVDAEMAKYLLGLLQSYFSKEFDSPFVLDAGSWDLVLTNTDNKKFVFRGSLCPIVDALTDISEEFRENLRMPDLFMFDGQESPDQIEEIKINYNRITKIKPNVVQEGATWEYVTWNYSESIEINREIETLTHVQNIGTGCKVQRQYFIKEGISSLLDDLYSTEMLSYIEGNDEDTVFSPLEEKTYEIEIEFRREGKRIIKGTFDKKGLPEDYKNIAETIWDFMRFYGLGEILDPSVYGKKLREKNDLIFCNVEFDGSGKTYCYLTDDDNIEAGDKVVVPVGYDNKETVVMVESIEYHKAEDAPYPVEKIKRILRKHED